MVRSNSQLTAAVVGLGHIAQQHLAAVQQIPHARVVAVCDRSPATAEATAGRFRIDHWYDDFATMLSEIRPSVVHVTTPPASHAFLTAAALDAGAHVIVEKPAAATVAEVDAMLDQAHCQNRHLIEDYNYVFNPEVQELIRLINSGDFGTVAHVDLFLCVDMADVEGGAANDENCLVNDFLPHFASLATFLAGTPLAVHTQWPSPIDFRAMVETDRATVSMGFCPHAQPNAFWLRVYGSKMQMSLNLFEPHSLLRQQYSGPAPLTPLWNGFADARSARRSAWRGLRRKLKGGAGPYEGLWALVAKSYDAFDSQSATPVTPDDIRIVNRFVKQLASKESIA